MNLSVARRMLRHLADAKPAEEVGYRELARRVRFNRFEILAYHQWCVLHEGFRFRDVTNLTGEAKWGSYLEDPQPGANLAELAPLWTSAQALERAVKGIITGTPADQPPLLIFHSDQGAARRGFMEQRGKLKRAWAEVLGAMLLQQNRSDYSQESIER